jgi:hypothetical protein
LRNVDLQSIESLAMPNEQERDRRNDIRFLTPLLIMAVILACGILVFAYTGHSLAAPG